MDVGSGPAHQPQTSGSPGPRVAYFGPDLDDPAVRRRVAQWRHAGFDVISAAFARRGSANRPGDAISFGRVLPKSRLRRILPLALAGARLFALRERLATVDLFIARNVDNAFLALFARRMARSSAPLVYEVLDINTSFTASGLPAMLLRRIETWVLARICLLVVSSPYFISAYYQKLLTVAAKWVLFENKVPRYARIAATRPALAPLPASLGSRLRPWRIGWFGYLDDERSWTILRHVAQELEDRVFLDIRGMPYNNFDMDNFLYDVERLDNVAYGGPYRNPEDLDQLYGGVDMVWSVDCNELDANSKWLLSNGIYEAGYFGKPVIGLADTAIGEFLDALQSGWTLRDPADEALISLLLTLTPEAYHAKCAAIIELSENRFVETDEVEMIWAAVQNRTMARRQRAPVGGAELRAATTPFSGALRRRSLFTALRKLPRPGGSAGGSP